MHAKSADGVNLCVCVLHVRCCVARYLVIIDFASLHQRLDEDKQLTLKLAKSWENVSYKLLTHLF